MSVKTYTDDQIFAFHADYLMIGNKSIPAFVKERGLNCSSLRTGFKRLNLEIIPQSITRRKYPINENFFESIDSEEKAYMLGFLYADGCNHEQHHKIEISLAKQDEDILIKFSKLLLDGNVNIKEYKSKKEHRVGLYLINQKISNDLIKLGCVARKTFVLEFPKIAPLLTSHFIRGYFDGDGMLTITERLIKRCKNKSKIANFSIVSTIEMLEEIGKKFTNLGVRFDIHKRHKRRENNNYTLRISGNQQIKTVCDYLYQDSNIFLNRKQQTYLELVELSKFFRKKYQYEKTKQ